MRTIAIANQKGGVGKTTTALNLATLLDRSGERVLLCDLDPQGTATALGLGRQASDQGQALVDALTDGKSMKRACRRIKWLSRAEVTLAGDRLNRVPLLSGEMPVGGQLALREALAGGPWDTVIIDCPPVSTPLIRLALTAADFVLIPAPMTGAGTRGLSQLLQTVEDARTLNPQLKIAGLLPTMVHERRKVTTEVTRDLQAWLGDGAIFDSYVRADAKVEALDWSRGRPVVYYGGKSAAASDYRDVLDELNRRMGVAA